MKIALTPFSIVVRKGGFASAPVDDDLVILSPASGNYVGLDGIGRHIWDVIAEPIRVEEICALMTRRYAGSEDEIAADVIAFLRELLEEGLIGVSEA